MAIIYRGHILNKYYANEVLRLENSPVERRHLMGHEKKISLIGEER